MRKRHNGQQGETLMETLGAILIFTFSSVALLTMLNTASTMNRMAESADTVRQSVRIQAEIPGDPVTEGRVSIRIHGKKDGFAVCVEGDRETGYVFYLAEAER